MGAWGWLPIAVPAILFVMSRLGQLAFPGEPRHRALAGPVLTMGLLVVVVRVLGALRLATTTTLLAALAAAVIVLAFTGRARPSFRAWCDAVARTWRAAVTLESLPFVVLASVALGIAVLTARWLPIWHWDSLGYHLPYVNFFIMGHGDWQVPTDTAYLSTYPKNIELYFVALRAMLPDDRLLDLGQIPFGALGAVATAAIARFYGAEQRHAVAAGCAWLLVPVVFLQLPSNYVDVGSAALLLCAVYFVSCRPEPRVVLLACISLGLYLGSKPNAPVGATLLALVLLVRAHRAGFTKMALLAVLLVPLLGAESFLSNLVHFGNPIWPIQVSLGPLHLPGDRTVAQILDTAKGLPRAHGPFLWRVLVSWTTIFSYPVVFDMRMGGFGPIFVLALPFAICTAIRARSVPLVAGLLAALSSPEPTWARFIVAFVALVLALASPYLRRITAAGRQRAVIALVASLGIWQLVYAWPGLAGEGPPLFAYAGMSEEQRLTAVGADGQPAPYVEARKLVGDDEAYAFDFDLSDELPYLSWEPNLRYRVVAIPRQLTYENVLDFLQREKARLFIAEDNRIIGKWAKDHPEHAVRVFRCHSVPCTVYERR